MKIPDKYKGKCFYHFTHIDNIESIAKHGILSTNEKDKIGIKHMDLANKGIQQRRSQMDVSCKPYGKIHDYVPFYFGSFNPMLISVLNKKNIDQPLIVYIAVSIDKLLDSNVIFTDASANTLIPPKFFKDPKDLDKLNWDLIDSYKWTEGDKNDLHSRMAEVLIYQRVPIDWIEGYVVFNNICKERIEEIYKTNGLKSPNISFDPFRNRHFYVTKYFMNGRKNETLITGPVFLEKYYREAIEKIINERKEIKTKQYTFSDIDDALLKIEENFCVIKELEGIFGLKTSNVVHNQTVSDHTIRVVKNLKSNKYYKELSPHDKALVKLSAYFHDIGKGPKSKWKDEIQRPYPDHPADSVPMIMRILIEEFNTISEYEIRIICLLVFYHDIIGDILERGRSEKELLNLKINENELNMLISISMADSSAINPFWSTGIESKVPNFIEKVKEAIC